MKQFIKKERQIITAIQINMELQNAELRYEKWGGSQQAKLGDWIVENGGDVYTIDQDSFSATYRLVSPGRYEKVAPVWAEETTHMGTIATKEGESQYVAGDYLVYNNENGTDGYAVSKEKFESMYRRVV